MHKTRIDLPEDAREKVVELLNARLADAIDLATQAKQAHWNVKGPQFIALHELFDKLHDEVEGHVDEIAERVTALGGVAEGTAAVVAERSTLPKYPLELGDGLGHVDKLATAFAHAGKLVRRAIDQATELRDADTADLFTGVSRDLDKALWLLEAHLQK